EIELLADAEVTILSDRRRYPPYGLEGGKEGKLGRNQIRRDEQSQDLPGKVSRQLKSGDRIRIETPGGGGHGTK
ncbi:MAG: hydantoinase B/oxoprolinase family protein, partial [Chloroflexi bacterium]|nr:hydantoinase B/oxoprolinase family protein [Chloroflexota bacterium]